MTGPTPVVEGIRSSDAATTGTAQFSFSDSGSLVYLPGQAFSLPQLQLAFVDRNGNTKPLGLPPAPYDALRLSPDGRQLTFDLTDGRERNIWVYALSGGSSMRRLTFGGTNNQAPIWSGDGESIVYRSNREGDTAIYSQRADGNGAAERLTKPESGTTHGEDSGLPGEQKFSLSP
jgi:Tol biopolymer transport system component